jgi:hypothetical protein
MRTPDSLYDPRLLPHGRIRSQAPPTHPEEPRSIPTKSLSEYG